MASSCHSLIAPQNGKIVPITEIKDPVFSQKILGDGIGIIPSENGVYSPISGTILQIAETLHAVCIQGDDGVEVLVHLGLDTVGLNGKGFQCYVKNGQYVSVGEHLMDMDIELIKREGLEIVSPCIITNMDQVKELSAFDGNAIAGKTSVINYTI